MQEETEEQKRKRESEGFFSRAWNNFNEWLDGLDEKAQEKNQKKIARLRSQAELERAKADLEQERTRVVQAKSTAKEAANRSRNTTGQNGWFKDPEPFLQSVGVRPENNKKESEEKFRW